MQIQKFLTSIFSQKIRLIMMSLSFFFIENNTSYLNINTTQKGCKMPSNFTVIGTSLETFTSNLFGNYVLTHVRIGNTLKTMRGFSGIICTI